MPRGKRVWRRRWYYVDHDTEVRIWELAEKYEASRPDILHAIVKAAYQEDDSTLGLLDYLPKTPFQKGDEIEGPTEGD